MRSAGGEHRLLERIATEAALDIRATIADENAVASRIDTTLTGQSMILGMFSKETKLGRACRPVHPLLQSTLRRLGPLLSARRRGLRETASARDATCVAVGEAESVLPAAHPRAEPPLDLFDIDAVEEAAGLPREVLLWPTQQQADIADRLGAARFIMDLLRSRLDLRLRFPRALTGGPGGAFATWLSGEGRRELGLDEACLEHLREALAADISRPLRHYLLFRDDLRALYPLGFTPAGTRGLFEWVATEALQGSSDGTKAFGAEAMWWLFLSCAEDPAGELARTYLLRPEWQRAHPHGTTVFGRDGFVAWLMDRYGLPSEAGWLRPDALPESTHPSDDIRLAYDGRRDWRRSHPDAFASPRAAGTLLLWLAGRGARLPDGQRDWCRARLCDGTVDELARPGVNLIGHFCFPSGLRASVTTMSTAMETGGLAVSRRDVRTFEFDEPNHIDFLGREVHDVTVIHVQAGAHFDDVYTRADLAERERRTHRVAYWYWELDTAPSAWRESADTVDEVWTATRFVADALRGITEKPVHALFPGVRVPAFTPRSRDYFGLPATKQLRFMFLFSFHMDSVVERKNPLGLIASFRRTFDPSESVDLVLKTTSFGNHDEQLAALRAAAGDANVHIIDRVLDESDIAALTDCCDAYVSLHRSEGLGLTMAEAMLLGKPVIATRYSGNLDFMDDDDSLLVDYELVPIRGHVPPYSIPGARWAEPDLDHASKLMRRVHDDKPFREALGERARRSATRKLSIEAAGWRFSERIEAIKAERDQVE